MRIVIKKMMTIYGAAQVKLVFTPIAHLSSCFRTDNSNPWSAEKFIVPWTFLLHILSICRKCGGRGMDNIYKQILLYCHQKFYFISDSCLNWAFDRHKALESCNLITVSGHNQNNNPLLAYYLYYLARAQWDHAYRSVSFSVRCSSIEH